MSKFRRGANILAKCRCCGKLTHSSLDGIREIELCRVCLDSAGQHNSHSDGTPHGPEAKAYCPTCAGVDCLHELALASRAEGGR